MRSWKNSVINSHMRLIEIGVVPGDRIGIYFTSRPPQSPAYLEL